MDEENELAKFKGILIAGVLFLISGWYSYRELRFAVWGRTAEAQVTKTFETREMRSRTRSRRKLAVEYTFTDQGGTQHNERDDVPISWQPLPANVVTVQYIPGVKGASRLRGNSHMFLVWLFCGSICWMGYALYQLYREAQDPYGKVIRSRR